MFCFEEGVFVKADAKEGPELAIEDTGNVKDRFANGAFFFGDDEEEGEGEGGEGGQPGDGPSGGDELLSREDGIGDHATEGATEQDEIGRADEVIAEVDEIAVESADSRQQ